MCIRSPVLPVSCCSNLSHLKGSAVQFIYCRTEEMPVALTCGHLLWLIVTLTNSALAQGKELCLWLSYPLSPSSSFFQSHSTSTTHTHSLLYLCIVACSLFIWLKAGFVTPSGETAVCLLLHSDETASLLTTTWSAKIKKENAYSTCAQTQPQAITALEFLWERPVGSMIYG